MTLCHPPLTGAEIAIIGQGVIDESRRADLMERLEVLRRIAADEPGTLAWQWYCDLKDPSVLCVYELYSDREALDLHREHVLHLLPGVGECFSTPIAPRRVRPMASRA
ncbi:putative quinol monooxygenase [Pseudonocardia oroxyli]|uniref:Quinol monooxygenase YgiN n=1 Tax=Pseudonocardia oroxyli TaxID=366584 RepID=A0A1G7TTD2_PSEOR|nr:antibiotic biosynthesis monooxygenase [Pseudonocardia oroxyli]SDG38264.1 Quinol monooxygenase YgiN [Pseudonocardia oroxyli]